MDYHDIPKTIRDQFLADKKIHEENCDDGWVLKGCSITGRMWEDPCPYCKRFKKELFDGREDD